MIKNKFKGNYKTLKKIRKRFYIRELSKKYNKHILYVNRTNKHLYVDLNMNGNSIGHTNTVRMLKNSKYTNRTSCINDMAKCFYNNHANILSNTSNYSIDTFGISYVGIIKLFIEAIKHKENNN